MTKEHKLATAKTIAFLVVAILVCTILKADGNSNIVAIPAGIGIATVALAVSEQQGGIQVDEDKA